MSVQSEIDRISTAKANLKTAIENGGVSVSAGAHLDTYPSLVDAITEQINESLDAVNGETVSGSTSGKLSALQATKADLKTALAEKGQTVGDVFSTYPAAVRAIETGAALERVTITCSLKKQSTRADLRGEPTNVYYIDPDSLQIASQEFPVSTGMQDIEFATIKNFPLIFIYDTGSVDDQTGNFTLYSGNAERIDNSNVWIVESDCAFSRWNF